MFRFLRSSAVAAAMALVAIPFSAEGAVQPKDPDGNGLTPGGAIGSWLFLGPYTFDRGDWLGVQLTTMRLDFLTDGEDTFEQDVMPRAGERVHADFDVAGSTGLARSGDANPDVNPEGIPQWSPWEQQEERIDLDTPLLYGKVDEVMCHAVCYLDVEWDLTATVACGSDDCILILVDDQEVLWSAALRPWPGFIDTSPPLELSAGLHRLMVKVFDIRGGWCFGCRIQDDRGEPLREGYSVRLTPESEESPAVEFRRGDANGDGHLNVADAVCTLGHLFGGDPQPACLDGGDANDDGRIDSADAVATLGHLFSGDGALPDPLSQCGRDPTFDRLGCRSFAPCTPNT